MTGSNAVSRRLLAVTGAVGGFFSGLTGVGGGAVMIPLMTGPLRMSQHVAHGTSLVVIVGAAVAGMTTYVSSGETNTGLTATLLLGSAGGAYIGARVVQLIPALRLRQVFGAFLVLTALRLSLFSSDSGFFEASGMAEVLTGSAVGLAGGIASGALGIGGGAIFVPGMVLVMGVSQHEAQGVSLAVIVPTAMVGALTHYRHGTVDLRAGGWIAMLAVPGGIAGGLAAAALSAGTLQRIFAAVILTVGIQMVVTATRRMREAGRAKSRAEVRAA